MQRLGYAVRTQQVPEAGYVLCQDERTRNLVRSVAAENKRLLTPHIDYEVFLNGNEAVCVPEGKTLHMLLRSPERAEHTVCLTKPRVCLRSSYMARL